jgi:hypothetical protein
VDYYYFIESISIEQEFCKSIQVHFVYYLFNNRFDNGLSTKLFGVVLDIMCCKLIHIRINQILKMSYLYTIQVFIKLYHHPPKVTLLLLLDGFATVFSKNIIIVPVPLLL